MTATLYVGRHPIIDDPINRSFEELVFLSEPEFDAWALDVRAAIAAYWMRGVPPTLGWTWDGIISDLCGVRDCDVSGFLRMDELTCRQDCIVSECKHGASCAAFFPVMGMCKDGGDGRSLWDYFTDGRLSGAFLKKMRRHIKRDGFYAFSPVVRVDDPRVSIDARTGGDWLMRYFGTNLDHYEFWFQSVK